MKHFTLEEKFNLIKEAANGESIGIHNYGLLHDIADVLDFKHNGGMFLRRMSARVTQIMRQLIDAGYPVKEYRIKCCSWTEKETWHPMFVIEEENKDD